MAHMDRMIILRVHIMRTLCVGRICACCNGETVTLYCMGTLLKARTRVGQIVLPGCARLPCHMLSMDIVATYHAVLWILILSDLTTVGSCCN